MVIGGCSWCQTAFHSEMQVRVVKVLRNHREEAKDVAFCNASEADNWMRSLGKRFIGWGRRLPNLTKAKQTL